MRSLLTVVLVLAMAWQSAYAEEVEKLEVRPTGRILMDGALYASPDKDNFPDGVAIPEVRLGANMTYGRWSSLIDVGLAYGKVGMRNMWIQYSFDRHNALRFGNFIHQYGLQSTSQSLKHTFEQPIASALFTPGIQLGAMFTHWDARWFAAGSVHAEKSAVTQVMNLPTFNQQGYGLLSRVVLRGHPAEDRTWHVGLSGGFSTPQRTLEEGVDIHNGFTFDATFPTKVIQRTAISATVGEAMNLFKFTPEVLLACNRLAFEGQYFYQQVNRRHGAHAFRAHSAYATVRGLIKGGGYGYSAANAQLTNPTKGALECVLDYNHARLTDSRAGIYGGLANSVSATFNYYFNPYITARLNYTFTHTWDHGVHMSETLNVFQARLMVMF